MRRVPTAIAALAFVFSVCGTPQTTAKIQPIPRDSREETTTSAHRSQAVTTTTSTTFDLRVVARIVQHAAPLWTSPPATTVVPRPTPRGSVTVGGSGPPAPISDRRCSGTIGALIETTFGPAGPWAESIAWRESNCQPTARNPSGSAGLFQLLGHEWAYEAAGCTSAQWADARCNVGAAHALFRACGTGPWSPPGYGCRPPD